MAANGNPTVRRRRLGAELRRLRLARGLTSTQVAERLLISQPKISHLENGRRAIKPRDVRDLCALYQVTDPQLIHSLMQMAAEADRQGWWVAWARYRTPSTSAWRRQPLLSAHTSPWWSPACCKRPPTRPRSSRNDPSGHP
ncbi:hypothetical protein GCM10010425_84440 [Streptomyces spororaveus]|uniref:HTH cro/C1-type domain-containing protein n=1 Tax=Streptomyces spororaveus TaxID=284039 RepID=A0ABQ3T6K2_9ACTN|nr:hypothetical protein Sspor_15820 [Streptomyces spororaveus]